MENKSSAIPIAIIIAGLIVAGSIIYTSRGKPPQEVKIENKIIAENQPSPGVDNIKPITAEDHILGNPDASVKIVEFSDTECPFCKNFHGTMHQLINEYGKTGEVAWVYRHFPIDQLHPKARKEAEATECAAELGGNDKFWSYLDRLFEITPSNNNLDPTELPRIAEYAGLDRAKFEQCLASGKYAERVQENLDDAIKSEGTGTPYSIIIAKNGKKSVINGALPYSMVKSAVEAALRENN